ncbi:hypothetical protein NE236_10040 [Actinoallomurus purpureus]|uniref:RNA polymerase sigma factor n=1 Tax=Actinoallomurus purpureus TaxID=478114 RepID=UPI00209354BF|nr:sigma-70 family RNA polymerase sigma factor [Actinoallomurus purpureus]MCO6005324.1 hypothetical protein [Actinoallomurus purpureus]
MSLTEDLRAGAPGAYAALYDEHAGSLQIYCHVMLGDRAAEAVRDAFVAVARNPDSVPADEDTLPVWLHALARAECVRHGAFVRKPATTLMSDPMWRALAGLEPEDRDVLALAISLVPEEIAWILNMAPDTAAALVQGSRRRLERALSAGHGQEAHDPVVLTSFDEDTLRRLIRRRCEPSEDQSERVLAACAAVEGTPDETLIFDADGMPVVPDPPSETADEPAHAFPKASPDPDATPMPEDDAATSAELEESDETPASRAGRAERRKEFRGRRIEGLLQAAALAALVLVAMGVMAVRSDHSSEGSSGDKGTGLSHERKRTAEPSVRATPPPRMPPSEPPAAVPSTDPGPSFPPDASTGPQPSPSALFPDSPFPPSPPVLPNPPAHHSKTPTPPPPTPSPTPTGKNSGSQTPTPSHRR